MWCIKREYEKGIYQDEKGKRYMVVFCDRVITHPKTKIEDLGYLDYNKGFDTVTSDLHTIIESCRKDLPDVKVFIAGHSCI